MIFSLLPPVRLTRAARGVRRGRRVLSAHGLRALSRRHRDQPFRIEIEGYLASIDYEPGEFDEQPVRRQLQLARPGVVPGELPVHRVDAALGRGAGARPSPSSTRPGRARRLRLRDVAADLSARLVSLSVPTGTGPSPEASRSSATTPSGATCCCSTSTSTATPGRGSAPRTRPAGRARRAPPGPRWAARSKGGRPRDRPPRLPGRRRPERVR